MPGFELDNPFNWMGSHRQLLPGFKHYATTDDEIAIKVNATLIRYFINPVRELDSKMVEFVKPALSS